MWLVMMFNVLFSKVRIAFDTPSNILTYSDSKCIYLQGVNMVNFLNEVECGVIHGFRKAFIP